jgi:hypothetical protein
VLFSGQIGAPDGRIGLFHWSEDTFEVTPILFTGDPAPSGGTFRTLGRSRANAMGDVAFFAVTELSPGGPTAAGLFVNHRSGVTTRVVRFGTTGDPAPGGGTLGLLNDFDVDDQASVHFAASLVGGPGGSGLFSADAPSYALRTVVREGDATPLGGTFGGFASATVRVGAGGGLSLGVPLSDDVGGTGLFTFAPGSTEPLPLGNPVRVIGVAALGQGRMAYQTNQETRAVVPADGTEEGPTDFRVTKLDLRNSVPQNADVLHVDGRFRLPVWDRGQGGVATSLPAVFPAQDVLLRAPDRTFTGDDLERIAEVRLKVGDGPGNTFLFGVAGPEAAPTGTLVANDAPATVKRLKVKDGVVATFRFQAGVGQGTFVVDLGSGTFRMRLARGNVAPSFDPSPFPVAFTLRSAADVAQSVPLSASFLHREVVLHGDQPRFGRGRRVVSKGQRVEGGTLFVDSVQVKRRLKARKGVAAPEVQDDAVTVTGTLRICPGATPPRTPTLGARVRVGDLELGEVALEQMGKGSRYRWRSPKGELPKVVLDVDVQGGKFRLKATAVPPLSGLEDADFSGTHPTNDAAFEVGGMWLPFEAHVARVYEAEFPLPMVRRKGGRQFQ